MNLGTEIDRDSLTEANGIDTNLSPIEFLQIWVGLHEPTRTYPVKTMTRFIEEVLKDINIS